MPRCETCGNDYDKAMSITLAGGAHCKCRIIGHGVEAKGKMFCCEHCAHA
jgi:hypothetical protein